MWDLAEASWENGYKRLWEFADREGHSRVPAAYRDADGIRLGQWVGVQRTNHRSGHLSEERQRQLEALPGWVWDMKEAKWEEGFAHLQRFTEREGHTRVPFEYRDADGFRLGKWVNKQRTHGKQGKLAEERRRRLEAVAGWVWDSNEAAWEDGYARLLRFAEREGHSRVRQTYRDDDGFRLGQWVSNQRGFLRRDGLSEERQQRLEAVEGWVWDLRQLEGRR